MWIKRSDRKILVDILLGNCSEALMECRYSDSLPADSIRDNEIYLIWDLDPKNKKTLPNIIVVANGHLRDFLAWAIIYFPAYRPFTAYFRVLDFNILSDLKNWFKQPSLDGIETACLGLIIGESLFLSSSVGKPISIAPMTCSTTISYVLARALALGATDNQLEIICENWSLARKLTEQPGRNLETKHVKDIFQMFILLRSNGIQDQQLYSRTRIPKVVLQACSQLKSQDKISDETWKQLTADVEELKTAQQQMQATREDRVRYFQKLLSEHSFLKLHIEVVQAFVCGYLGSLIGPGSLSHIDLVTKYFPQLPTALLWYGLCAGFHKKNELLTSFNVLGRRLMRELLRYEPVLSSPVADIAVTELQILLEGNEKLYDFRTFMSNRLATEIYPCISTYLAWPKREVRQQMELFPKPIESNREAELLSQLGSALQQALKIHRSLVQPEEWTKSSGRKPKRETKKKSQRKKSLPKNEAGRP